MTGTARRRAASVVLTAMTVLGTMTPTWTAQADPPRGELRPARPLAAFPAPVRIACHAWREAGWPRHDNWYALGRLGRVRGGRLYPNTGPQPVLPGRGVYHQYDVPGPGYGATARGQARFVRGGQHGQYRLYYTDDHYASMREIRPAC